MTKGRFLAAAVITAAFLGAGGGALGFERVYPTTQQNIERAQRDSASLLAALQLPPGSRRTDKEPDGDGGVLGFSAAAPASPNLIDETQWWIVPGDLDSVIAFIRAHPPADARLGLTGRGSGPRPQRQAWQMLGFTRPRIWNVLGWRALGIIATQLPDGTTGLRADGNSVWMTPRPATERIPPSARAITVALPHTRAVTAAPRDAAKILALIDNLEIGQPGLSLCPVGWVGVPRVTVAFRATPAGAPLAVASVNPTGCTTADLTIGGQGQPTLNLESRSGFRLIDALESVLGVALGQRPGTEPISIFLNKKGPADRLPAKVLRTPVVGNFGKPIDSRLAAVSHGVRYFVVRGKKPGAYCLVSVERGGFGLDCSDTTTLVRFGAIVTAFSRIVGKTPYIISGIVRDGYDTASAGGKTVKIRNNVFVIVVRQARMLVLRGARPSKRIRLGFYGR